MTTRKNKCPKCGATRPIIGIPRSGFLWEKDMKKIASGHKSTEEKLRVMTQKYRKEKARLDALEANPIEPCWKNNGFGRDGYGCRPQPGEWVHGDTLRQLADKLIDSK